MLITMQPFPLFFGYLTLSLEWPSIIFCTGSAEMKQVINKECLTRKMCSDRIITNLKLQVDQYSHFCVKILLAITLCFVRKSDLFLMVEWGKAETVYFLSSVNGNCSKVRTVSFSLHVNTVI